MRFRLFNIVFVLFLVTSWSIQSIFVPWYNIQLFISTFLCCHLAPSPSLIVLYSAKNPLSISNLLRLIILSILNEQKSAEENKKKLYVNLDVMNWSTTANRNLSYDGKLLMLEGWLELYRVHTCFLCMRLDISYVCINVRIYTLYVMLEFMLNTKSMCK